MQIQKISGTNWKCIPSFSIEPKKFNVLLGPNGAGKTSLIEAIKCSINGSAPEEPITAGALFGDLSANFDKIGAVFRTWEGGKKKLKLNGRGTTQKSLMETIMDTYGFSSETTNIMSSSDNVEAMFGKDFAAYLLSFTKNDMDVDKLIKLSSPSTDAAEEIRMHFLGTPIVTLENIAEAYTAFREMRANLKGRITAETARSVYTGPAEARPVAVLEASLSELRRERAGIDSAKSLYARLKKQQEDSDRRVIDLERQIALITDVNPSVSEIRALETAISTKHTLIAELKSQIRSHEETSMKLLQILTNLETSICPISAKLICTTDKSGLRDELSEEIDSLEAQKKEREALLSETTSDLAALNAQRAALDTAARNYSRKLVLLDALDREKASKISLPEPPDTIREAELDRQIAILETEKKHSMQRDEAEKAANNVSIFTTKLEVYEELVALFAPNGGARQKVLEHNIGPLQDYCNEKMRKLLPIYSMEFDTDNGFEVVLKSVASGETILFDSLSTGEKMRCIYIITDMLNQLNKFRILLLDNLDGLDAAGLKALAEIVLDEKDNYDHVFFAAVENDTTRKVFQSVLPSSETEYIDLPFAGV